MKKKNLLFIDYLIPTPDQDAGSLLAYNTLMLLKNSGFNVIMSSFSPHNKQLYKSLLQRNNIFFLEPMYLDDYLSRKGSEIDFIYGTRYNAYGFLLNLLKLKCLNAKFIFHTVDIAFLRETRELNLIKKSQKKSYVDYRKKQISILKKHELNCIKNSDLTILTSSEEMKLIRKYDKISKLAILGFIMKPNFTRNKFNERKNIMFLGNYNHVPNLDAVKYFVSKILPKLIKAGFKDKFIIAGYAKEIELKKLEKISKNVKYVGYQKNLCKLFDEAKIFVSPLRYGAGIKGKLATSISYSTEKSLINEICKLYYSENDWNKYKNDIENLMESNFGVNVFAKNLTKCFKMVGYNKVVINSVVKLYD